jgi:hypothetical protein
MVDASDAEEEFAIKNDDPEDELEITQSIVDAKNKATGHDKKTDEYLNEEFEDRVKMYVL